MALPYLKSPADRSRNILALLILIVCALQGMSVGNATASQLQIGDLLSLVQPQEVTISPDGAQVAYVYTVPSPTSGQKHFELQVQRFVGGAPISIGSRQANNRSPVWSPDGTKLAFYTSSGERNYIAIWNASINIVRVMDIDVNPNASAQWTPDGTHVLVSAIPGSSLRLVQPTSAITVLISSHNHNLAGGDVISPPLNSESRKSRAGKRNNWCHRHARERSRANNVSNISKWNKALLHGKSRCSRRRLQQSWYL